MAQVITIANNKGGVGKTTTAVNVAASLRLHGFDVLLVDYDGQSNLTEYVRADASGGTTYDAMRKPDKHITPSRLYDREKGKGVLDVLPSSRDLSALEVELSAAPDRITRFGRIVERYRDGYDFILIDTAPTMGLLCISALYVADEAIITVQPHYLAVRGLLNLKDTADTIATNRGKALPFTVLFTQYDRRKGLHRLIVEQVKASKIQMFDTTIRDNIALAEAPAVGMDIFSYKPKSYGAEDYAALTAEYLKAHRGIKHVKHQ
jgi:chromosome partitioning protein